MYRRFVVSLGLLGIWAGLFVGVTPAWGQGAFPSSPGVVQTGPQAATPAPRDSAANGGAQPATGQLPRPQVVLQEDPEVEPVLRAWEAYTRNIERLHGTFDRYVYDSTFLIEKRAVGEFWYEAPDKGRLDFAPAPENRMPQPNERGQRLNAAKLGPQGQPYSVIPDASNRWICRGDALLAINLDDKTYHVTEIPAHLQGKNIVESPLPFLFGMSADEMRKRYYVSLGVRHDPRGEKVDANGQRGPALIHLLAVPKLAAQAAEFSRAEVLLDPGTIFKDDQGQRVFVPYTIRLFDPTGQQETVYVFNLRDTKLNERTIFTNLNSPFRNPRLWEGFKLIQMQRLTLENDPNQRSAEALPPGNAPASNGVVR